MSRLTNKYCNNYDDFVFSFRNSLINRSELDKRIYKKLKHLEDIEEELGIDLITLFRALKNGIFKKGRNDLKGYILFDNCPVLSVVHKTISYELTENYGKTWALTREELE